MSAIDSITPASSSATAPATGFSALTPEDFTKLITTELANQDPLQPSDTNALLQQISSVRSIQSDMDLTDQLDALVSQNQFSSAATLIGKSVSGVDDTSQRVSGTVTSLSRTSAGTYLTLDSGQRVSVANLDEIDSTPATPTSPTTPPTPPSVTPTTPAAPSGTTPITGPTPTGGGTL